MNAFLAGTLFGFLFAGSIFVAFVTRTRKTDRRLEKWEDPFEGDAPVPVVIHNSLVKKRNIEL